MSHPVSLQSYTQLILALKKLHVPHSLAAAKPMNHYDILLVSLQTFPADLAGIVPSLLLHKINCGGEGIFTIPKQLHSLALTALVMAAKLSPRDFAASGFAFTGDDLTVMNSILKAVDNTYFHGSRGGNSLPEMRAVFLALYTDLNTLFTIADVDHDAVFSQLIEPSDLVDRIGVRFVSYASALKNAVFSFNETKDGGCPNQRLMGAVRTGLTVVLSDVKRHWSEQGPSRTLPAIVLSRPHPKGYFANPYRGLAQTFFLLVYKRVKFDRVGPFMSNSTDVAAINAMRKYLEAAFCFPFGSDTTMRDRLGRFIEPTDAANAIMALCFVLEDIVARRSFQEVFDQLKAFNPPDGNTRGNEVYSKSGAPTTNAGIQQPASIARAFPTVNGSYSITGRHLPSTPEEVIAAQTRILKRLRSELHDLSSQLSVAKVENEKLKKSRNAQ